MGADQKGLLRVVVARDDLEEQAGIAACRTIAGWALSELALRAEIFAGERRPLMLSAPLHRLDAARGARSRGREKAPKKLFDDLLEVSKTAGLHVRLDERGDHVIA